MYFYDVSYHTNKIFIETHITLFFQCVYIKFLGKIASKLTSYWVAWHLITYIYSITSRSIITMHKMHQWDKFTSCLKSYQSTLKQYSNEYSSLNVLFQEIIAFNSQLIDSAALQIRSIAFRKRKQANLTQCLWSNNDTKLHLQNSNNKLVESQI